MMIGRWWPALATLAVGAAAMLAHAESTPTRQDCVDAWNSSTASDSCGQLIIASGRHEVDPSNFNVAVQNDQCSVDVHCRLSAFNSSDAPISNTFVGSVGEVAQLKNCSGYLKKSC